MTNFYNNSYWYVKITKVDDEQQKFWSQKKLDEPCHHYFYEHNTVILKWKIFTLKHKGYVIMWVEKLQD